MTVGRVEDLAHAAVEEGFEVLRGHTFESTLWIISTGIARELAEARRSDIVLVDRAVPDALGYLRAALQHRDDVIAPEKMKMLSDIVRHHSPSYDLVIKTDICHETPIEVDGIRDVDPYYRVMVDQCIEGVVEEFELDVLRLSQPRRSEVEAMVKDKLLRVRSSAHKCLVIDWLLR